MLTAEPITFVVPVPRRGEILENNFLSSPCLRETVGHQVLIQENFTSAGRAFNDAIHQSVNDLLVFVHHDVLLPRSWTSQLGGALAHLEHTDANWGVLGCWGATRDGQCWGYIYSNGLGVVGKRFDQPMGVQTLDEIVLVLRKSSGLRFDEHLPGFHFQGSDICLAAARNNLKSYAISAFCIHNNSQYLIFPKEFYESYQYFRRKWKTDLPIQTPCIRVTKTEFPMYARRLREIYLRYIRHKEFDGVRSRDVNALVGKVEMMRGHQFS